jgi:hypothetical protein
VLLLLTGASGVDKSTVRRLIAPELPPAIEAVELTGLAPAPAALSLHWRQQATEAAVTRAVELQGEGRHLLLAGDPVAAIEVAAAPSAPQLDAIAVCLLDASAEVQGERLAARGDDPALLPHHVAFAEWMRRQASDPLHQSHVVSEHGWDRMRWERLRSLTPGWGMETVDTSALTEREVAGAVLGWCDRALAGGAPAIRLRSADAR